jgi:hypothetical protein
MWGYAIAEAVTVEVSSVSVIPMGLVVHKFTFRQIFLRTLQFSPAGYHSTNAQYTSAIRTATVYCSTR